MKKTCYEVIENCQLYKELVEEFYEYGLGWYNSTDNPPEGDISKDENPTFFLVGANDEDIVHKHKALKLLRFLREQNAPFNGELYPLLQQLFESAVDGYNQAYYDDEERYEDEDEE